MVGLISCRSRWPKSGSRLQSAEVKPAKALSGSGTETAEYLLTVPGADVRVAFGSAKFPLQRAEYIRWLQRAANAVSAYYLGGSAREGKIVSFDDSAPLSSVRLAIEKSR